MDTRKKTYKVLGVMSGTSLDGIDIAALNFQLSNTGSWHFEIGSAETCAYPPTWTARLKEAIHYTEEQLHTLNADYTAFLAEVISEFMTKHQLAHLDAVCSHGHTILHQPENGITLQIGNLPELATCLRQTVVCDFRVQDVALGGQGAPLVPVGDALLFSSYEYCLNLGGFANCSYQVHSQRIAYDICPVNIVLNALAEKLNLPYDEGGNIARNGTVDLNLLDVLNTLHYYKMEPPKSLGLEWVQQFILPIIEKAKIATEDAIATFTEHIATQVARQFTLGSTILVTGGGAYNTFLLERIRYHTQVSLVVPEATLLEFKEALIFGLLGVLKLRDEVNCLASVTGASHDHSSGTIFYT